MPTINGIFFAEDSTLNKSPTHRWAPENCAKTRRLYLPYDDDPRSLDVAALALTGYARVAYEDYVDDGGPRRRAWIERVLPDAYPATPTDENLLGEDFLYAASIPSCEPCAKPEGVDEFGRSKYSFHRYTVNYETLSYNVLLDEDVLAQGDYYAVGQTTPLAGNTTIAPFWDAKPDEGDSLRRGWVNSRFVTKQVDPASRNQTLPQGLAQFVAMEGYPAGAVHAGLPMIEPRALVSYTWHCVPILAIPEDTILNYYGKVNVRTFDRHPPGTLLFEDARLRLYRTASGQRVADVTYRMIYKPNYDFPTKTYMGWNSSPRVVIKDPGPPVVSEFRYWPASADGGAFTPFSVGPATGNNKLYQYADPGALFRPQWPWPY